MLEMQMKEHLEEENEILERCLRNIFTFFEDKKLLPFDVHAQLEDVSRFEAITMELSRNFVSYQEENEQRYDHLLTESLNLQQAVENMSTSLKLDKEKSEKTKHFSVQFDSTSEELENLGRELEEVAENCKRYELMLFVKEEEIKSLKVVVSDYENKMGNLGKSETKVRARSYKKYFDGAAGNLSATVT